MLIPREIHVHHHIHHDLGGGVIAKLDAVLARGKSLPTLFKEMERKMSAALDRLTAAVARNTSVDESAIALLNGLAQQIRDLKDDPAALEALATELEAKNSALSDAVTANTPAVEPPAPGPDTTGEAA